LGPVPKWTPEPEPDHFYQRKLVPIPIHGLEFRVQVTFFLLFVCGWC
jgi:hypothetical protein